jgi:putative hydrolase of HD superfamily
MPFLGSEAAAKVIEGLHAIPRTGWVRRGVENPETVGEHSDALVDLAQKVCETRPELNQEKLERMVRVHDWPEYRTGDIVTVTPDAEERARLLKDKFALETAALESICSEMGPEGAEILALWHEFEAGVTPEAKMAKQLDKLQAMLKAWEYQSSGAPVRALDFIEYDGSKITDPLLLEWFQGLKEKVAGEKK